MIRFATLAFFLSFSIVSACAQDQGQAHRNSKPFDLWLEEFKEEARSKGISEETLQDAFLITEPMERVIALDRSQPEGKLTLSEYLERSVTEGRIREGRRRFEENRDLLMRVGKEYGVQPRFIVALWGIETNYGKNTGGFDTIGALATLAYDGRRSAYFRDELMKALQIIEQDHISPGSFTGSWAGAMGQCQFMPTSFLEYAVDEDGDGKRDIWETLPDVFASIASYLKSSGWNDDYGWGFPVRLPKDFDLSIADIKSEKSMREWDKLGVKLIEGGALPDEDVSVSLIMVGEGDDAEPYIIYNNYKILLKWNRSRFFATAVGTLADNIGQ